MLLSLLSPLIGILGSLLPSIVRIFERKQEIQYELELAKLKIDASTIAAQVTFDTEAIKAAALEGQSLRDHDSKLDGGPFLNALRASIRPVITYIFFGFFIIVKIAAAYTMLKAGQSPAEMLQAVWDSETMALFSTILAFWFGSRIIEKVGYNRMPLISASANAAKSNK